MAYRRTEKISQRLAARRRAILLAARSIVTEHGFQALNMQLVADTAGVAIGTLYRYFPSRADLCIEVVTGISERELMLLRQMAGSGGPALGRLWSVINSFSQRALQARTLAYALMAEPVEPELVQLRLRYRRELADVMKALIREGIAEGKLPPQNVDASAAAMVGGFIEGVIGAHASELSGPGRQMLSDDISCFCLRGAGVRARDLAHIRSVSHTEAGNPRRGAGRKVRAG